MRLSSRHVCSLATLWTYQHSVFPDSAESMVGAIPVAKIWSFKSCMQKGKHLSLGIIGSRISATVCGSKKHLMSAFTGQGTIAVNRRRRVSPHRHLPSAGRGGSKHPFKPVQFQLAYTSCQPIIFQGCTLITNQQIPTLLGTNRAQVTNHSQSPQS